MKYTPLEVNDLRENYVLDTDHLPGINRPLKILETLQFKGAHIGFEIMGKEYKDKVFSRKKTFNIVMQSRLKLNKATLQNKAFTFCEATNYARVNQRRKELRIIQKKYGLTENHIIEIKNKFKALLLLSKNKTRSDYQDSSIINTYNNKSIMYC